MIKTRYVLLVLMISSAMGLIASQLIYAQVPLVSGCTPIKTRYPNLTSNLRWVTPMEVVFTMNLGLPPGGFVSDAFQEYQYHVSTGRLEEINADTPLLMNINQAVALNLTSMLADSPKAKQYVYSAPSQKRFIIPRNGSSQPTYWLVDLVSGLQYDLGVPFGTSESPEQLCTFWSADENTVIVELLSNLEWPILQIKIDTKTVLVQHLVSVKPWVDLLSAAYSDFTVAGVSPTGKYVIAQPDPSNDLAWLNEPENNNQVFELGFHILGGNTRVAWFDDQDFVAITVDGIVQYNIPRKAKTILIKRVNMDLYEMGGTLSPDGHFLIAPNFTRGALVQPDGLLICKVL